MGRNRFDVIGKIIHIIISLTNIQIYKIYIQNSDIKRTEKVLDMTNSRNKHQSVFAHVYGAGHFRKKERNLSTIFSNFMT